MIELIYVVNKEADEYKEFIPEYLLTKNKWDLFFKNISREFNTNNLRIPLLDSTENIPDTYNCIDMVLSNIILTYDTELPIESKILLGLELLSKIDNSNIGTEYTYKVRNYITNPKICKYLPILDKVTQVPTIMLYKFIGNCTLLISNSVGRISVVTPSVTLDKNNNMKLTFRYKENGNIDEFIIKEPIVPKYVTFNKEVIYDE